MINNNMSQSSVKDLSWEKILFCEWKYLFYGSLFSFILASVVMSGWPGGLLPNLEYPFGYSGDSLFSSWLVQRAKEGWIFNNSRCGYPFGSNFLDYPVPDLGSLLVLKTLVLIFRDPFKAVNLYYLLGFPFVFIASYIINRKFKLSPLFAFVSSILYAFAPFHFMRLGHLFYTWYFVAPIFYYIGYKLFSAKSFRIPSKKYCFLYFLLFMFLSSFGVYYALFGIIIIGLSGLVGSFRSGEKANFLVASIIVVCISIGVLLSISPNLIHKYKNGSNPEVAVRSPVESEIHGFKMVQLILPSPGHRIKKLATITEKYNRYFPLIAENSMSSLGIISTFGLILLFIVILFLFASKSIDTRLSFLSTIVFILFLFGTIGGFGALFALIISPSIRAWNRISIFIAYGTITAFFVALQSLISSRTNRNFTTTAFLILIMCLGFFDQTSSFNRDNNNKLCRDFKFDKKFFKDIETLLPENSSVYQLPYISFPESGLGYLYKMHEYDMLRGFLHTHTVRWNQCGIKGREGDLFYRALSNEPVERQIDIIKKLGFAAVYIDRRGYEDNGNNIIDQIAQILGTPPILSREDGQSVLFKIPDPVKADFSGKSHVDIMKYVGYSVDDFSVRYSPVISDKSYRQIGKFNSTTKTIDINKNESGFLHFGPYVNMKYGHYSAQFRIEFPESDSSKKDLGWIDVAAESGTKQLAHKTLSSGESNYNLDFEIPKNGLDNVEFRVYSAGSSAMKLCWIKLERK